MAVKKKPSKKAKHSSHAHKKARHLSNIDEIASSIIGKQTDHSMHEHGALGKLVERFEQGGSFGPVSASDEEVALGLAAVYFKEVARLGFKRSLEIDDILNAFFYSLARVKRKDVESKEIMGVIKRAKSY